MTSVIRNCISKMAYDFQKFRKVNHKITYTVLEIIHSNKTHTSNQRLVLQFKVLKGLSNAMQFAHSQSLKHAYMRFETSQFGVTN